MGLGQDPDPNLIWLLKNRPMLEIYETQKTFFNLKLTKQGVGSYSINPISHFFSNPPCLKSKLKKIRDLSPDTIF